MSSLILDIPYKTKKIYWDINDPSKLKGADNQIIKKIKDNNNKCQITGIKFTSSYGVGRGPNIENPFNPSLDRIDSSNPDYTNENTQVTSLHDNSIN